MNKKVLLASIMLSLTTPTLLFANTSLPRYELDPVIVTSPDGTADAPKTFVNTSVTTGILGKQHIQDTIFTQHSLTQKAIDEFANPGLPAVSVLQNLPSVKGGATMTHNDFSIRGHYIQGGSFYVNGIPGLYSQMNSPTHVISNMELFSGPNVFNGTQMEKNSIAGTVNFITKKAQSDDKTTFTHVFQGRHNTAEYIDISKRFGDNKELGIRINGEWQRGEMSLKGSDLTAKSLFINLDYQRKNSSTNVFTGYRHQDVKKGMRWFKFDDSMKEIPKVPDAINNYSFEQMRKEENSFIFALNHEQYLNNNVTWFTKVGLLHSDLKRNVSPQASFYTIKNTKGDYTFNARNGRTPNVYQYYQTGFNIRKDTGRVNHNVSIALDYMNQNTYTNSTTNRVGGSYKGNLYTGSVPTVKDLFPVVDKHISAKTTLWGISLMDTISVDKWNILLGGHSHHSSVKKYDLAGAVTQTVDTHAFSPVYGVLYKPNQNVSIYASHTEGFSKGEVVGNNFINKGDIISPLKSKENEIGIKYMTKHSMTNLALFNIKEAKTAQVTTPKGTLLSVDGEVEFKGVELYSTASINQKWNVFGGFMYVDAIRNKTDKGKFDGLALDGSSKWNGVIGAEYNFNNNTKAFGRVIYNGKTSINQEKLTLPSYTTVDLGVSHKANILGSTSEFTLSMYNAFNKSYWHTRSGGNEVLLSLPRTVVFSSKFTF